MICPWSSCAFDLCNVPDVTFHNCNSNSCHFRQCYMLYPLWLGLSSFCILFMSCISSHVIMCISFAFVFVSCIRSFFPVVRFGLRHSHMHPMHLSDLVSWAGEECSGNGPRFVEWPWYITGRPPVKFCSIWRSFDAPMVNCVNRRTPFSFQPSTPPHSPSKHPPCPSSLDHDRVGENCTSIALF